MVNNLIIINQHGLTGNVLTFKIKVRLREPPKTEGGRVANGSDSNILQQTHAEPTKTIMEVSQSCVFYSIGNIFFFSLIFSKYIKQHGIVWF